MVNNIPVNGWPQLKDLEAVQPILNRLDKIEAWKRTVKEETFTGEEITIPNALALPARSLITEINAIQDLHGYDKPWAGGAGKNKLQVTATSTTISGVTFTVNSDGTVIVNGTATAQIVFVLNTFTFLDGVSYTLNGAPTGSEFNKYFLSCVIGADYGSGATFTGDGITNSVRIIVQNGITCNNLVFKPMIRLATETDPTFAPYSNICPISGRDSVVLTRSDGDEISEDFTIQLGTTVYGAEINWDTGVMMIDRIILTNFADAKIDEGAGGTSEWLNVRYDISGLGVMNGNEGVNQPIIIAKQKNNYTGVWQFANANGTLHYYNSNTKINAFYPKSIYANLAAFKTYEASNKAQFVLPLATPTTIQLTPTMLEMLKGVNRVTLSDGYGTIELKALTGANWS